MSVFGGGFSIISHLVCANHTGGFEGKFGGGGFKPPPSPNSTLSQPSCDESSRSIVYGDSFIAQ